MGVVDEFFRTLGSNLPPTVNGDRMRWKLTKNGVFNIRSFYNKLRNPLPIIFPWKGVWKVKAPQRVSFFVWTAVWERILTSDNLRDRRMVFVDWCIMCRCNEETVDHLLLHCDKAYRLWSLVIRSFGIFWVLPRSIADTLFGWWNWPGKQVSSIWNLAPLCLMWCLWRERNNRLLRTWKVRMTSYWPLLVALCLIGLGPGDSPLVIPSLCSLVFSCIISLLSFLSFLFFLYLSNCTFLFALCFFA